MKEMLPEYIIIGQVAAPRGFKGHIKVDVETDFPDRFSPSSVVYIDRKPVTITDVSWQKGRAVIKLDGLNTDTEAKKLNGKLVEIHNSQLRDLPEGRHYFFQLIGLEVKTTGGELIGKVTEILTTSGSNIYVVQGENGEVLVPATDEFVKSIDTETGVITIEPVDGLLNLNEKKKKP